MSHKLSFQKAKVNTRTAYSSAPRMTAGQGAIILRGRKNTHRNIHPLLTPTSVGRRGERGPAQKPDLTRRGRNSQSRPAAVIPVTWPRSTGSFGTGGITRFRTAARELSSPISTLISFAIYQSARSSCNVPGCQTGKPQECLLSDSVTASLKVASFKLRV